LTFKYPKLGHYLAGLIEGDGSIKVNLISKKGKKIYPSITICFASKDLPLAKKLANLIQGTLNKGSGNWYVLSVYKQSALYDLVTLINGKFRTPKIEALHRLIIWLNNTNKFNQLELLPLDNSPLKSNGWLAGFSDSDGNFLIQFSILLGIAKNIKLTFRISLPTESIIS